MTTTIMPIADGGLAMMTLKHNVKLCNVQWLQNW